MCHGSKLTKPFNKYPDFFWDIEKFPRFLENIKFPLVYVFYITKSTKITIFQYGGCSDSERSSPTPTTGRKFENFGLNDTNSAYFSSKNKKICRACFFKKIQDWILNPKESENGFCVSLLNRSTQDVSDHGASKEPKNPLPE